MKEKYKCMSSNNELVFEDFDSEEIVEIPQEQRKITTQAYDKSVSDIVRMISEKEILLDPDYQRSYVWDNKKASKLIESILLNVPIPVVYVSQEDDDSWSVIDGLQRLYSLKRFFDGKFKLTGLEVLSDLNKSDFNSLNPKAQRILKNGLIRVIMITNDSNEEIKYDVFMRLNTGSVHLTEQELRNCLYRGKFNSFLKKAADNTAFLSLLGLSEPHKRMADRELILRFLAIQENWDEQNQCVNAYKGRMKLFLNEFMHVNKNSSAKIDGWQKLCEETINKVIVVFGIDALRRINDIGEPEGSINRAIYDILMLSMTYYSLDELSAKKELILKHYTMLYKTNSVFKDSLLISTSDKKVLNTRIGLWLTEMKTIMGH